MAVNRVLVGMLFAWGKVRGSDVPGLCYPSTSPVATLRETAPPKTRRKSKSAVVVKLPKRVRAKPPPPRYFPTDEVLRVQRAYEALPPREQLALWCRYVGGRGEGMAESLAAQVCGVPLNEYASLLWAGHRDIGRALNVRWRA